MVYDPTDRGRPGLPGLSHSWWAGGLLYRGLGRIDAWTAARSWSEALDWLATVEPSQPIGEIQYWGHGKWGRVMIDDERLDIHALEPEHELHEGLKRVRQRLIPGQSQWWFRTCETFGAEPGHAFAKAWTDFFGCPAAGHTYIIGPVQSGLHRLRPGQIPNWSVEEGLAEGTPEEPKDALWSKWGQPNTISCLHGRIPANF